MQQKTFQFHTGEETISLNYADWGDSQNPKVLLCVHGLVLAGPSFDRFAKALSADYRVICPDIVGRGQSSWLANKMNYRVDVYAGHIMALLQHLGVGKVDWVGTSMGGLIAWTADFLFPGVIRKLVVNDIGPFLPQLALKRIAEYISMPQVFANAALATQYLKQVYAPFNLPDEAAWEEMFRYYFKPNGLGGFVQHYDPGIALPFSALAMAGDLELWALWEKLSCPAMVLRGKNSDLLLAETAYRMRQKPGTEYLEIDGAGHAPSLMTADQISAIHNWLRA